MIRGLDEYLEAPLKAVLDFCDGIDSLAKRRSELLLDYDHHKRKHEALAVRWLELHVTAHYAFRSLPGYFGFIFSFRVAAFCFYGNCTGENRAVCGPLALAGNALIYDLKFCITLSNNAIEGKAQIQPLPGIGLDISLPRD